MPRTRPAPVRPPPIPLSPLSITLDLDHEALSFISAALNLHDLLPLPTEEQVITALCAMRGQLMQGHLKVNWQGDDLSHTVLCNRIRLLIVHLHDKSGIHTSVDTLLNKGVRAAEGYR